MRLPNFGYHLARIHGRMVRRIYSLFLPLIVRAPVRTVRALEMDVFAYSSEENLPEQVASIRSFLRHAGRPARFIVVSDGSHSDRSIHLLECIESVSVRRSFTPPDSSGRFVQYLLNHPTGKQMNL